jgi:hypothetical protein
MVDLEAGSCMETEAGSTLQLGMAYIIYPLYLVMIFTLFSRGNSGFVNVYGSDSVSSRAIDQPKPLKAIGNLTTSISTVRFNHDSQLLAIASSTKKDQMRMVSIPRPS